MGTCIHCDGDAGLFRTRHADCVRARSERDDKVPRLIAALESGLLPDVNLMGMPIHMRGGERPVWGFSGVVSLAEKTRRKYAGGSAGVSLRIAKGVRVPLRVSRGTAETVAYTHIVDQG